MEPETYSHYIDIETTTLSEYVQSQKLGKIKLFKLEAEGFEPEILEGSSQVLKNIEYIAIDGGYRRGKNHEETFSQICNSLLTENFEMISINFDWRRALFLNKRVK